jgi:NAD(P)-dependent dehydrogenase (short-subunit alcohol dehydrogenase family)
MNPSNQTIALVTGANRGIGLEIARQLAAKGIHVIATSRSLADGEKVVAELTAAGHSASTFAFEVTDAAQQQALFDHVQKQFGRLDILVNNAGIAIDQWTSGFDVALDKVRDTMDVNFIAPLRLIQLFIPLMKTQGHGRIVNMSSELASMSTTMMGSTIAYRTSKAALNCLTKLLACELKDFPDILINAAAPGWCQTELGGEGAPRSAAEGADTPVWLATLPAGGANGGFFRDRKEFPW